MKIKTIALSLFSMLVTFPTFAQNAPKCPLGDGWKYVAEFSDEFEGAALDGNKWWDFNPSWIGRRPGLFCRDNVAVKDGCLQISATRMPEYLETVENHVRGFKTFATGIVKSKKRIKYGYFEARCKAMDSGATSAFWLYDPLDPPEKYRPGSYSEEIDIFEIFGRHAKLERTYFMTYHRQETPYVEATVRINNKAVGTTWIAPHNFVDDFHVYALEWTEDAMVWYVDGVERWRQENANHKTALHIMFDSEIMESWGGLPDLKDLPSTFYIDYVRVWQK